MCTKKQKAILEAVYYSTNITIFVILSLIFYLWFTTANVKFSAGQREVVNWVMNTN